MGVPGGAPLYSLSVAWVSICEALAPKRVLHLSMALFCLLLSYFQASESSVNKGVQRSLCYFTRPFSCLNRVNAILVYHGSCPNNRKHKYSIVQKRGTIEVVYLDKFYG